MSCQTLAETILTPLRPFEAVRHRCVAIAGGTKGRATAETIIEKVTVFATSGSGIFGKDKWNMLVSKLGDLKCRSAKVANVGNPREAGENY